METFSAVLQDWMAEEFKSYYVVWKRYPDSHSEFWHFMFKSYYVVWKHERKK